MRFLKALMLCCTVGSAQALNYQQQLGVNAQLLWFARCPEQAPSLPPLQVQDMLDRVRELGVTHVRMDLHWDTLEPIPGHEGVLQHCLDPVMKQARQAGVELLPFLTGSAPHASSAPAGQPFSDQFPPRDPEQYAHFLRKLALRYPWVKHWQVWNEPNLPVSWRAPSARSLTEGYGKLLQASKKALQGLPTTVVTAGFAYWSELPDGSFLLENLAKSGALNGIGTVAYHPYTFTPSGLTAYSQDPRFFLNRSLQVNKILHQRGKKVWATEFGWSVYPGPIEEQPLVSEQQQADFLLKRLVLFSGAGFERFYLFTLSDLDGRASVRDRLYGLIDLQNRPRPAFHALKRFLQVLKGDLKPISLALPHQGELNLQGWKRADGRTVVALWGTPQKLRLPGKAQVTDPLTGKVLQGQQQVQVSETLKLLVL